MLLKILPYQRRSTRLDGSLRLEERQLQRDLPTEQGASRLTVWSMAQEVREVFRMQRITQVDAELATQFATIVEVANQIDIPIICDLSDENEIAKLTCAGIYKIDICTTGSAGSVQAWVEALREEWEHEDYLRRFTPNFKKKRIKRHATLNEWMPLYLGKSKRIGARVLEHINLQLDKTTFALKLKARPHMSKYKMRLCALPVNVTHYDLIVPTMESVFRDRFNPLIGKQ